MSGEHKIAILLLAFAGACVDTASYLGLGRIFTANMTGNTIVFVLALTQRDLLGMARSGVALGGFVFGVVIGELILIQTSKYRRPPLLLAGLTVELVSLLILGIGWWRLGSQPSISSIRSIYPLIVFSAIAMGIQSAVVRDIRKAEVATTYITGTLTLLWARFADWIWALEWMPERKSRSSIVKANQQVAPLLPAGIWVIYAIGAIVGGFSEYAWHSLSLSFPILAVAIAIVLLFKKLG